MATIEVPERSPDQRMAALKHANVIRATRKNLKVDLKHGRRIVSEVILDPPEHCAGMKVYDLLIATPKVGRVKAGNVLSHLSVSPSKTIGGLSKRQRTELARFLSAYRGPRA